jgi:hypothetical protein
MRYTDRIKNLSEAYPRLARVWIKTDNPKLPLKSVWMDESQLASESAQSCGPENEGTTAEVADEHLLYAA